MLYVPSSRLGIGIASGRNTPERARAMIVKVRRKARLIGASVLICKIGIRIECDEPAVPTHTFAEIENIYKITRICRRGRRNLATSCRQPRIQISCKDLLVPARLGIGPAVKHRRRGRALRGGNRIVTSTSEYNTRAVTRDRRVLAVDRIRNLSTSSARYLGHRATLSKNKDLVVIV